MNTNLAWVISPRLSCASCSPPPLQPYQRPHQVTEHSFSLNRCNRQPMRQNHGQRRTQSPCARDLTRFHIPV